MIRRTVLTASLFAISLPLYATTYTLERDYTQGVFRWNHLGFVSPAAQISQGEGTLQFDAANPTRASVQVTFPLKTMNTGVPDLDDDFRSSDFFDTEKFPTATFTSTKVEMGAKKDQLRVTGNLSVHGITKPVILDVMVTKVGINPRSGLPTVGFEGSTLLKRSDWDLGRYVPQVSDNVEMHITSQAVETQAYTEYLKAQAAKKN
jgi:polyisoprenoid-binding protein YceI